MGVYFFELYKYMINMRIPIRYVPAQLTTKDRKKQVNAIKRSRKLYKKHVYYTRPIVKSFKKRKSNHIEFAKKMYKLDKIVPNKELSKATRCTVKALKAIVRKGEGAYFSSGSRPNQTAQSWGLARLASAVSGGKSSVIDYSILENGCAYNSKALNLAKIMKEKGVRKTRKIIV
jgi:hypothetical protein